MFVVDFYQTVQTNLPIYTDYDELMMKLSNGNVSALLALCEGNSPVTGEFPSQRPVARNFDVFFDLRLNKRLSKQWWGWWLEYNCTSMAKFNGG